jgi:hypothetical protein
MANGKGQPRGSAASAWMPWLGDIDLRDLFCIWYQVF